MATSYNFGVQGSGGSSGVTSITAGSGASVNASVGAITVANSALGTTAVVRLGFDYSNATATPTYVASVTFTPIGTQVMVSVSGCGYGTGSETARVFGLQVTNGSTVYQLCQPGTPGGSVELTIGGVALYTGLTPGNPYNFTVQGFAAGSATINIRASSQSAIEFLTMIVANA